MRNAKALATMALRRLQVRRWLSVAGPSALLATAVAAVALVTARVIGWDGAWIALVAFVLAVAACMRALLALRAAPSLAGAAAEVDERLGLDGRVATALALAGRSDAFAQAAVADGERVASEGARAAQVRRAFPLGVPPTLAWWPVALCAVALLAWMVPVRVLRVEQAAGASSASRDPAALAERADNAEARVANAVKALDESPEAKEKLADLLAEVARPPAAQPAVGETGNEAEPALQREAEALQRAASIEERLGRELDLPEMLALTQMNDSMARLPELKGAGAELSQALKSGDLQKAMAEMQKLAAQAASGDPKAAAEAKQALEQLAAAMDKASQNASAAQQQALEQSLKQAGLDPKLAKDPAAAQAAAQKAAQEGKCTAQQAQQVAKQAQGQKQAQQQQQQMAQSMRECSNGSSSSANSQLSRQQAQRRMQAALQTAMRECRNPSALGWSMPWQRPPQGSSGSPSDGKQAGKGGKSGKAGQGGDPKTDGSTKALADSKVGDRQESAGDGDPLDSAAARDFVRAQGVPVGTSQEQVRAVAAKVAEGLEEGSEEDPVPARLKAAHKRYFEEWKRRVDQNAPAGTASRKPAAP
ncbi:MAG: hypothetical protein ACKPEA_07210 [Planctomycetota bacterium]